MSNYYRTYFDDDEGINLTTEQCMNIVDVFRPIDSDFVIQLVQDRRKKGFYRYSDENSTTTLVTLDLLFKIISLEHNKDTLKEIKIIYNQNEIKFNCRRNVYNDYLVGFRYSNDGMKDFFVTKFNLLPHNITFCYRNIII
tara:strand:+ start:53 stop:472 length:420 start_codon:yes stop_codon:yes gene_type:complete